MVLARGDWFFLLLTLLVSVFMVRPYLYAVQQDNYRVNEIFHSKRVRNAYIADVVCVLVFGAFWGAFYFVQSRIFWGFLTGLFFFIAEFALYFVEEMPARKKPFRYTRRAVRAIVAVALSCTAAVSVALACVNGYVEDSYLRYLVFFGIPVTFPLLFSATLAVVNVFERINNRRYERRTRRILAARPDLIKIAVTGSFGKTSVKNMLAGMLSEKYRVLVTPESYNTPMGISKTVKELDATHEVFIAEMGARRKGDIRRLMRIVRPEYAVLTGINDQHLQTFGSREAIVREKLRVLDVYTDEGIAVVSDTLAELPRISADPRTDILLAGSRPTSPVRYSDVAVCEDGSVFTLDLQGIRIECMTRLLGKHNIANITLAAAMAYSLGVSPERIADAVARLEPTPHRLQLIEGNGIKIIDDSFNSNPQGAACALEVLSLFNGRKVVVTPGMVELGEVENEENRRLGNALADVADVVMLVGKKRVQSIRRGLQEKGFDGTVLIYDTLSDAEEAFKGVLHIGDVLLLLNDLPDCYDE